MADFVKEQGISYPVAADVDEKTVAAYRVDSFPDYYLIDKFGNLRVADLANGDLERAVKVLLAEKGPKTEPPKEAVPLEKIDARVALQDALKLAKDTDRKVFVHLGGPG